MVVMSNLELSIAESTKVYEWKQIMGFKTKQEAVADIISRFKIAEEVGEDENED